MCPLSMLSFLLLYRLRRKPFHPATLGGRVLTVPRHGLHGCMDTDCRRTSFLFYWTDLGVCLSSFFSLAWAFPMSMRNLLHIPGWTCHMHGKNLPPRRRISATSPERVASAKERPHTVKSTQRMCDFNTGGPGNDGLPKDPHAAQQGMQPAWNGAEQSGIPREDEGGVWSSG